MPVNLWDKKLVLCAQCDLPVYMPAFIPAFILVRVTSNLAEFFERPALVNKPITVLLEFKTKILIPKDNLYRPKSDRQQALVQNALSVNLSKELKIACLADSDVQTHPTTTPTTRQRNNWDNSSLFSFSNREREWERERDRERETETQRETETETETETERERERERVSNGNGIGNCKRLGLTTFATFSLRMQPNLIWHGSKGNASW